jgi:hypothetical protein
VHRLNNNNKKNPCEIITKPLKPRLKRFNGKGNRVIQLFIKLYKKMQMPQELNNNNKKTTRK